MHPAPRILASILLLLTVSASHGKLKDPNDAQVYAFAAELEKELAAGNAAAFDVALDIDEMMNRAVGDLNLSSDVVAEIRREQVGKFELGSIILKQIEGDGSYKYLRVVKREKQYRALFRMVTSRGGINYHELTMQIDTDAKRMKIVDILSYYPHGILLSEVIREQAHISQIPTEDTEKKKFNEHKKKVIELYENNQYSNAKVHFDELPEAEVSSAYWQYMHMMICAGVSKDRFIAVTQAVGKKFSKDPCYHFNLYNAWYTADRTDYMKQIKALESLDKMLNDSYIDFWVASTLNQNKQYKPAVIAARRAISRGYKDLSCNWVLITSLIKLNMYADAVKELDAAEKSLGITFNDLSKNPECDEFRKSKEYKAWLDKREKEKKED